MTIVVSNTNFICIYLILAAFGISIPFVWFYAHNTKTVNISTGTVSLCTEFVQQCKYTYDNTNYYINTTMVCNNNTSNICAPLQIITHYTTLDWFAVFMFSFIMLGLLYPLVYIMNKAPPIEEPPPV